MGLDSVELLLRVEEAFNIKISNAAATQIDTVGDLHSCVLSEMARGGAVGADPRMVFLRLRDIIVEQQGVKPELVTPDARIVEDLRID